MKINHIITEEDVKVPGPMRMNDYHDQADAIQEKLRQAIQTGNKQLIQQLSKQRDDLDAHVKTHGMMPEAARPPIAPDPQNYNSDWDYYNDRDADTIPTDTDADYENMDDAESDDWFDESQDKAGKRGRGRPRSGEQDSTPITPGRVEKTSTGIRHHADSSRYGGTEPDAEDDHLMSRGQIYRLEKATQPEVDEGKDKVGNMDADAFDAALSRMKKLAGAGPLRTVYDPNKRVYKNVPHAVQPAQQPKKSR